MGNKPKTTQPQTETVVQGRDLFQTPRYATELLVPFIPKYIENVWECASGEGKISDVLREHNYDVLATDLNMGHEFNFLTNTPFAVSRWEVLEESYCVVTNPPFCYDEKTEVLTKRGWLKFKDINKDDYIFSVNVNTNDTSWDEITKIVEKDYNGNMIYFNNRLIDLIVTPNHRMFIVNEKGALIKSHNTYKTDKNTDDDFVLAKDIKPYHRIKRTGFNWINNENINNFIVPSVKIIYNKQKRIFDEITIPMNLWVSFFGFWLAEGSVRGSKKLFGNNASGKQKKLYEISFKQKEPCASEFRKLLNILPFKYREYYDAKRNIFQFEISSVQLWTYFSKIGNSRTKYIPIEIKNLNKEYLQLLFDWYMLGDGSKNYKKNKDEGYFYTVSKKLADDFMEICIKLGFLTSSIVDEIGGTKIQIAKQKFGHLKNKQIIDYSGKVYCVTLKNNSFLLVRRNGKLCFSGNSLKYKFIKKAILYDVPFAFLIPFDMCKQMADLFTLYDCQGIVPNRRIDYITPTGKSGKTGHTSYYHSFWITRYFDLPEQLKFVELTNTMKENI